MRGGEGRREAPNMRLTAASDQEPEELFKKMELPPLLLPPQLGPEGPTVRQSYKFHPKAGSSCGG